MSDPASAYPDSCEFEQRRSGRVFTVFLLLVLFAVAFPEIAPQFLQGLLWTVAGLLMFCFPPVVRVPWGWILAGAGFVLFALVGFLPRGWFHFPSWRGDLESLGLFTGASAFVQPRLAAEAVAGFAATAAVSLFLLGHRVDSRCRHRLVLGFALGVGAWTLAALLLHEQGGLFGFFPNRNHTATLLVMGTFAGFGSLAHSIRRKNPWTIALAILPVGLCLHALIFASASRAGLVLVFAGFVLWMLLAGFRSLQGNVGKALALILIAASGTLLIVDSTAKKRIADSVERLSPAEPVLTATPENPFASGETTEPAPPVDGRISIFQDTLEMIRHESWTGVGPGQFAQVFPQYREKTNASNDAKCLHPESDWLMMLAETGWPASLCLGAGVLAVFVTSAMRIRRGRSRFLRMGCLVAAWLLCLHGLFDVPGHRVGLAWAAAMLLALSLTMPAGKSGDPIPGPSRPVTFCWRGLGLILALAGGFLLQAQWTGRMVLSSEEVRQCMREAKDLYDQDQLAYDKAMAEGKDYQPAPAEDPMEAAIRKVTRAIELAPLDPYPYYVRGALALHYDDKQDIAERSFAIQSRLDPRRVNLAMEQATAWSAQDPRKVLALWKEALRRALLEESRHPDTHVGVSKTYQRALQVAGRNPALFPTALELAGEDSSLWLMWAGSAPPDLLDREMPRLLSAPAADENRGALFQIWEKRGTKDRASNFAGIHPELGLSPLPEVRQPENGSGGSE